MRKGGTKRRPWTRPGKGRAFVRFLIGEVLLFILCGAGFLLLSYEYPAAAPAPTASPTPAPTASPTPMPTFEPTPTPIPERQFSERVGGVTVPKAGEDILYGMIDCGAVNGDGLTALSVNAYAYLKGADAAESVTYLTLSTPDGMLEGVYSTLPAGGDIGLEYEESDGQNLDQACFKALVDVSSLSDGWYTLGIIIVNGERASYTPVDVHSYSFIIKNAEVFRYTD